MKGAITGIVKSVLPIETREYNGKTFESRQFIVETTRNGEDPKYAKPGDKTQAIKLQCGFQLINDIEGYLNTTCNIMYQLQGSAFVNKLGQHDSFTKVYCNGIVPIGGTSNPAHAPVEPTTDDEEPF